MAAATAFLALGNILSSEGAGLAKGLKTAAHPLSSFLLTSWAVQLGDLDSGLESRLVMIVILVVVVVAVLWIRRGPNNM